MLRDVQAVQAELESVDTGMVSGEGRHLVSGARSFRHHWIQWYAHRHNQRG
jgi:hypothetical protein